MKHMPKFKIGVGCHFLLQCMKVKSENEVAQSCPTLSMDCSPPRLLHPWDFPGKSTGVGCHHLLQDEEYSFTKVDLAIVSLMNDLHVRETTRGECSRGSLPLCLKCFKTDYNCTTTLLRELFKEQVVCSGSFHLRLSMKIIIMINI